MSGSIFAAAVRSVRSTRAGLIAVLTATLVLPQVAAATPVAAAPAPALAAALAAEGTPVSAKVVFTTAATGVVPDATWTKDTGAGYSDTVGRGWVTQASLATPAHTPIDLSINTRYRVSNTSTCTGTYTNLQRSLIHMQAPGTANTSTLNITPGAWEYAVPNGTYQVTVGIGDLSYGGDVEFHTLHVEGTTAFNRYPRKTPAPTTTNVCGTTGQATTTVWTTVTDGKLTVDAIGGQNTKLDYVTIDSVPLGGLTAAVDGTAVALDWDDLAGATSYRVWRSTNLPVVTTGAALANPTTSTFTDTTAVLGQVYYYAVAPATGTTASVVRGMVDTATDPTPSWPLKVNFEGGPNASGGVSGTTPAGWTSDSGKNSAHLRGFGWIDEAGAPLDLTKNGRFRASETGVSATLTSTMHMQGNTINAFTATATQGTWQLAVPDGSYDVTLAVGDALPGSDPTSHTINVERTPLITDFKTVSTTAGDARFKTASTTTVVSDGFLTVDAIGGQNTKLDYITVTPTPADQPPAQPAGLTATAGSASVALTWTANTDADLKGYNVFRSTTATVALTTPLNAALVDESATSFTDTTAVNGTTYYYVLVAVDDADQNSAATSAVSATPQPTTPALATLPIKINFTAETAAPLAGWTKDFGAPFTNTAGRGWVAPGTSTPRSLVDNARLRLARTGVTQTDQQRGLVHMESGDIATSFTGTKTFGSYEFAVADGFYDVTVSVGDQPGAATASCVEPCYDSLHSIVVEDRPTITTFQGTAAAEFSEKTATRVQVTDGRLTVATGGATSVNTKINYLEIAPSDVAAPAVPTQLTATAADMSVGLSWTAVTDADLAGYRVYRSEQADVALTAANRLTAAPLTAAAFTDSTAVNGTTYHYVVTSIDLSGNESDASGSDSATPADTTAPAAPTALAGTAGDATVTLQWASNAELDLDHYNVYRSTTSPVVVSPGSWIGTAQLATYTDSGTVDQPLVNGTEYFYAITAVDALQNESTLSAERALTPSLAPDVTAPVAPAALTAAAGDNTVTLGWAAGAEGDIASYQVLRSATSGTGFTSIATAVPASATSYVDTTALNGNRYYYVITATDLVGNVSSRSAEADAVPADTAAPSAPAGVTATAGIQRVVLNWTPNTEPDVARYRIYRFTSAAPVIDNAHLVAILTTNTGTTFVDTARPAGVRAWYAVIAVDETGNLSEPSAVVDAVPAATPDTTAPGAPTQLAVEVTDRDVSLSWTAVTATDLAGYKVYRSASATGARVLLTSVPTTATTFLDAAPAAGTVWYYVVTAVDTAGNESPVSNQVSAEVPAAATDAKFSFSPATAAALPGYTKETGAAFDITRGYGFVTQASLATATHAPLDMTANTRLRTRAVTDLQNRFVHLQYGDIVPTPTANGTLTTGAWEYILPNGRYAVTASVGDQPGAAKTGCVAPCYDSLHTVRAEGITLIDRFQATAATEYGTGTATVDVTDGRLTIDAIGGTNTKLNWVGVVSAGPVAPDTTAPAAPVSLTALAGNASSTLSWAAPADTDVVGYQLYRSTGDTVVVGAASRITPNPVGATSFTDTALTNGTTYRYVVTAVDSSGNESAASAVAVVTPDAAATSNLDVKVNFQDAATAPPTGYLADFGQAFGSRTGTAQGTGRTYGWVKIGTSTPVSIEGNGRNRNTQAAPVNQPDLRLATFMHMQLPASVTTGPHENASWELAVPNGWYDVKVGLGDPGTAVDSTNWLNIENQNAVAVFVPTATTRFVTATRTVQVTDGRLTLSPESGTNTKIDYVDIASTPLTDRTFVIGVHPANLATDVVDNVSPTADISPNQTLGAVDNTTLGNGNVTLTQVATGANVAGTGVTSGGADTISFAPAAPLAGGVLYRLSITAGVKDIGGRSFLPFSTVFTTANSSGPGSGDLSGVAFDKSDSGAAAGKSYTSLVIGPDGKLYAGSIYGYIYRWAVNADGTLGAQETITTVRDHATAKGWEGAPNRTIIGLTFDPASTAENPILWISDNYAYFGTDVPDFTGAISKLTGPNLQNYQEVVVNLPRSIKDHETNSIAFQDGKLLIVQGSMNAMGRLEGTWRREEHLLSAAMLQLDPAKLPATLPLDVATPEMAVPARGGVAKHDGTYNPYAADAALTLYATGIRNAFDLVAHSNGRVYAGTNGSAAGGNTPATPNPLPAQCATRPDGPYTAPTAPAITNNGQAETDYLFDVHQGKYYGHPNPLRCEYVLNAGNPTGYTGNPLFKVNAYPAGQLADPNYDLAHVHDAGLHASANGSIEYKNTVAFGGALAGAVIVVRYSANQEVVAFKVTDNGGVSDAVAGITGFTGFRQPLDVAQDVTTGNLYVSELTDNPATTGIKLLKPQGGGSVGRAEVTPRLVFTDVANTTASPAKNVSIKNTGGAPLTITSATLSGGSAASFARTATFPFTVAAGATATIPVTFNPAIPGVSKATLTLATSSTLTPSVAVALRGLGTIGTGGSNEPSLQWILDTLDIPVDVGDPDPTNNAMPEGDALVGDEVAMQSFTKLLFDRKVDITPLSLFGPAGPSSNPNTAIIAAHKSADVTSRVPLWGGPNTSNQTVLPAVTTLGEWDLDDAFGFDVTWPGLSDRVTWSEDAKNTWATNKHKIRVYPLKDSTGAVVVGSYLVAPEDVPTGVDYQDAAFIVSNVKAPQTVGAGKLTVAPKELVFSGTRGSTSATQQATLTNTGTTPLVVSTLTLTGTAAASFALSGLPTLPLSLAVGESTSVGVQFKPGAASTVGAQHAALTITSDDPTTPSLAYGLHGLATTGEQGNNEPTLKAVVDTLGYPIDVGGTSLILGVNPAPIGDEVSAPLFVKAGTAPVTITPVARYSPDELLPFGWYLPNAGDPVTTEVASIALDQEQTLNPRIVAGGGSSFDPGTASFGFFVDSRSFGRKSYTQDGLNTNIPHAVRTYPAKNRAGVAIPGTYLVTFEDAQNGDYQDYVFLVTGVSPAGAPSTGAPVARIDYQPATSTVATGYTADTGAAFTAAQGFGWVVPGTSTPLDMTAQTRDRAGTVDAKLRTVVLAQPTAAQSPNGPGAWEYVVPNGTYVVTVGVGDSAFVDSTHRVQVEGQTVVTGFAPTTANPFTTGTATVAVTDGRLTIDAIGGTNTKLTYVDIDRPATGTDATAPVVDVKVGGLQAAAGSYKNTATVTVTATDTGSGIAGISYSLDGGAFLAYAAPVQVTTTGSHTVRARAQDAVGNVTTTAISTFRIVTAGASKAVIALENADGVPYVDRLVMNRIQNPQTGTTCKDTAACDPVTGPFITANVVHDTASLVIRNTGTEALNVTELPVTGPFVLVGAPTLPALVPVGGSLTVQVRFTAGSIGTSGGLWSGSLTVGSDDPTRPSIPVELAGFWQSQSENNQEPDVAELAKLFGWTTTITAAGVPVNQNGTVVATGDEILSPYWVRADSAAPVSVRQLAAFHTQGNTATFSWHPKTSTGVTTLFTHVGAEGQSILPRRNATNPASGTFTPTGAFGLRSDSEWSDPTRNSQTVDMANGCTAPCGHHMRAWVVRDRSGAVVPNTYLIGMDYSGINYDYNDNLYLLTNAKPEIAADPSAPVLLPGAAGLQLPFTSPVAGTLGDATGLGTGFVSTQPNKLDRTTGSSSYVPSKLHLGTTAPGTLVVDSSATGATDATGTNGAADNTLINGLQLPFDASGGQFTVTGRVLGALDGINAGSEQQSIMLGADQDNFAKVGVVSKSGVPAIEFYSEIGGAGVTNGSTVTVPSPASVTSLELALIGDPSAGTVRAAYRHDGGGWSVLPATWSVPAAAHGKIFGARQFAGILVSHKGGTAFSASYDSWGIAAGDVTATAATRSALYRLDVAGAGTYTDTLGQVWSPDTGRFSPASAIAEGASTNQEIAGTDDDVLYRTYRGNVGSLPQAQRVITYTLPSKGAAKVDLRLHFAERAAGNNAVGKRVFSIDAEGTTVRSNFDIFAAAGATNTAVVLPINNVTVTGGQLTLSFSASVDYPSIAAIEVLCQGSCPAADTEAPAAVTGLTGVSGAGVVTLDWNDSAATDVVGYQVYRSATETGTYSRITTAPVTDSTYVDTTATTGSPSYYRVTAVDSSENESTPSATVSVIPPLPATVRINAGGAAQTVGSTTWSACSSLTACGGRVTGGGPFSEADTITGVPTGMNNTIFQSEWTGGQGSGVAVGARAFGFAVPVSNGSYRVRLHYAELNKTAANQRLFDVRLENSTVAANFDVFAQAGGIDRAIVREYPVVITDGVVNIDFITRRENAKISAIEIIASAGPDTTAPAQLTGVSATGSATGVTVAWSASAATDLAGYTVYRSSSATGTYTKLNAAPVTGTSYSDTTAPQGVAAFYQVTASDTSANESVRSATVSATRPDTTAPGQLTGVSATGSATGVTVTWSASAATDLAGYTVYRSATATGTFVKVNAAVQTGTSITDTSMAEGETRYYQVTATDTSANESVRSATVNARRLDTTAPAQLTGVTATGSATGVTVAWSASAATDLAGYSVYRSTSATGTYLKVNTALITATSFTDTSMAAGETRYYQVTASDTSANESVRSAAVSATRTGTTTRPTIRINTGGAAETVSGTTWSACSALTACSGRVTGGGPYSEADTITGIPAGMSNTMFRSEWTGGQSSGAAVGARAFGFAVPVTNGYYRIRLHFAELNKTAANLRLFDVRVENTTILSNFDIFARAGGIDRAIVREYTANVTDGVATIDFITRKENAKVSAIEIIPVDGPDITAPAAVTGATATGGASSVTLTWSASAATDLVGYHVYRAPSAGGTFVKLTGTPISPTSYTDSTLAAGSTGYYQVTAVDTAGNESSRSATVSAARTRPTIRINTGGPAQTVSGTSWSACSSLTACSGWVSGGFVHTENDTISGIPAGMNATIFRSEWTGGQSQSPPIAIGARAFGFQVPVSNGSYRVRLHFVELSKTAANQRLFDVRLENSAVLSNFDVWAQAGGIDRAIVREIPVTIADGAVTIDFITRRENAKITAIEILPTTTPDVIAPAALQRVAATASPAAITVASAPSSAPDVQGYNVYRSSQAGSGFSRVNARPLGSVAYVDTVPAPGATAFYQMSAVDRSGNESKRSVVVAGTRPKTVRINAGGSALSVGGIAWTGCRTAAGCTGSVVSGGAARSDTDRITGLPGGTSVELYRSQWAGTTAGTAGRAAISIRVAVPKATYRVRLHFAELSATKSGARTFDVNVEGRRVVSGLDVLRSSGGQGRVLVKEYRAAVVDGKLDLDFIRRVGAPIISAIEVIPVA